MQTIFRFLLLAIMFCNFSAVVVNAETDKSGNPPAISKNTDKDCPMLTCIDNCTDCHNLCLQAANYCLNKGAKHADAKHIKLLVDCAQMCQTSADFMNRQSTSHPAVCQLCADLCNRCADSCEALNDENLKDCIDQCRKCAKSCTEMGSHKHAS